MNIIFNMMFIQRAKSQEISLGHAIFVSSEYGYRRIARSISNKSPYVWRLWSTAAELWSKDLSHAMWAHYGRRWSPFR